MSALIDRSLTAMLQRDEFQAKGRALTVSKRRDGDSLTVAINLQTRSDDGEVVLHWGLRKRPHGPWRRPPKEFHPAGTTVFDNQAVDTPFTDNGKGEQRVVIHLHPPFKWDALCFVLHFPETDAWIKNGRDDFAALLPLDTAGMITPKQAAEAWVPGEEVRRKLYELDSGEQLAAAIQQGEAEATLTLVTDAEAPLLLHWGVDAQHRGDWAAPDPEAAPTGTKAYDEKAVRTPWAERDGLRTLRLTLPAPPEDAPGHAGRGINAVLYQPSNDLWIKAAGNDMHWTLFKQSGAMPFESPRLVELAEDILAAESKNSWTLMHRCNLCHDLLGSAESDPRALALLFVWMRYSAIRQLTWQRHYNTKPSLLAHSQGRLGARLAAIHRDRPGARFWARLLLTCCGRGGEGQQVRDEILHIMHRNKLKEAHGTFMEEWHQKLHNNSTPDDIVICEAYLAFLESDGDLGVFYETLEAGGITRERLASYERKIVTDPIFFGDNKDALIRDFENYRRILKSVHAGADLEVAAEKAMPWMEEGLRDAVRALAALAGQPMDDVGARCKALTEAREALVETILRTDREESRLELLFLDLALEDMLRQTLEQTPLHDAPREDLVAWVALTARHVALSTGEAEFDRCRAHWEKLSGQGDRDDAEWAFHAKSVADRLALAIQTHTSALYAALQPTAEFLGQSFGVEAWAIPLFSEEVIRGGPAFALSKLLRALDPILRKTAGMGGWQVVSPGEPTGHVRCVESLLAVQEERYDVPTILVSPSVSGDEEIPPGVVAVLTTDTPDLVSHVAVRARNVHVLMATCYDADAFTALRERDGEILAVAIGGAGELETTPAELDPAGAARDEGVGAPMTLRRREASTWAVTTDQFQDDILGGKSNNLNGLRGRLADWIKLPASMALPFGVYEKALAEPINREVAEQLDEMLAEADGALESTLGGMRTAVGALSCPEPLREAIQSCWIRCGLPEIPWEQTWRGITRVWASKWNERAYLSRRARSIPHDHLQMAVLIQQVVDARYAYVIHTVNPISGAEDEIFVEVVRGLGETLVGNYPGRALGCVLKKGDLRPSYLALPSKPVGLFGRGVIFRSDSNGEDLEGFAGAGLYDSFLAEEPEEQALDNLNEPLFWDRGFRDDLLRTIGQIALEVERACGSPQDIEGAKDGDDFYVVQTRPQVGLEA